MAIRKKRESQYFVPKTAEDWAYLAETFKLKKEPNIFQKTWGGIKKGLSTALDVLSTPLYATAGAAKALVTRFDDDVANDENPLKEFWKGLSWQEKEDYYDVLKTAGVENKYVRGIVGTAMNIFLDPTNYMSGAGLIKNFNKLNGKHLTKEGLDLFKQATKQTKAIETLLKTSEFGDDAAKTLKFLNGKKRIEFQLAQALKSDPDKYFKGIEMFGQNIIPRQFISGGLVGKLMGKESIAQRLAEGKRLNITQKFWQKMDDTKTTFNGMISDLFGKGKGVTGDVGFMMDNATGTIRRITEELWDKIYDVNKTIKKKYGQEAIQEGVEYQLKLKSLFADKFKETIIDKADQIKKLTGISISKTKKITDERMDKIFGLIEDKVSDPAITKQARTLLDDMLHARSNAMDEINKLGIDESLSAGAKEYLKSMQPISQQIQNISGLKKGLNLYIPSLDKNYLMKMAKQGAGKNIRTKVWKEFNNLIGEKNLVKDPMTAWGIKTGEIVKNKIATETKKNLVDVYGMSVKKYNELLKTGALTEEMSHVKIGKQIVGYLRKTDNDFVNGVLNPELGIIDNIARFVGYDQFTSVFKRAVTSLFPAFHVRNYISGTIQNYEVLGKEAFNPINVWGDNLKVMKAMKNGSDDVVKWGGKTAKVDDYARAFKNRFLDSGMYSFDNKEISNTIDGILGFKKRLMLPPEKIGQWTEMQQKASAYVIALKNGYGIDDALKLAEQAGFDYRNLSKFESSVMKRLIPFYAFARKNAELQVKTAISTPARILNQKKILDSFSEIMGGDMSEQDVAGLPPWVRNALKIKIDNGRVVSGLDFPIQEFFNRLGDPVKTTITSMNPILKYPLESEAGYDFFRGKQIKDIKTIDKPLYDLLSNPKTPSWIKDAFQPTTYTYEVKVGKEKGKEKTVYEANPFALHKLRMIPTSRIQNTLETLLGEGTKTDKVLSFLLGAKIYDIDQELQKYYEGRDLQQELREDLMRLGGSYEFTSFQVPKEEIEQQLQNKKRGVH
jgi:hypothetical protein